MPKKIAETIISELDSGTKILYQGKSTKKLTDPWFLQHECASEPHYSLPHAGI